MINLKKWDNRFLKLAKEISFWSKDPSTQVGCVITDTKNRIIAIGYNGFPRNVIDLDKRYVDRDKKYSMILHAEINTIIFTQRNLKNYTIYTYPMPPCARYTGAIIQSGIKRIVSIKPTTDQMSRWGKEFDLSQTMYDEAEIKMYFYNIHDFNRDTLYD